MTDNPSGQPAHMPFNFQAPAVQYDEGGNAFFQDVHGRRFAYYGQFSPSPAGIPVPAPIRSVHDNMRDGPNEPLPQAFWNAVAGPSTSAGPAIVIDPSLVPLPNSPDDDLSDGPTIAKSRGHRAAEKVAGTRRSTGKGKGKERAVEGAIRQGKAKDTTAGPSRKRKHASDDEDEDNTSKRGRPKGVNNYTPEEVSAALDFIESEKPLGSLGWKKVHRLYTRWARLNRCPERALKSLETKFKQLVKTKKPTGDAYCPPDVQRAHQIDELITEHSYLRDISDGELNGSDDGAEEEELDDNDGNSSDEVSILPQTLGKKIRNAIVCRPDPTIQRRTPRNSGIELMSKLSDAFDPSTQQAREAERANRSMQTTQFLTLSQQLRDANTTAEGLRSQINDIQARLHEAEQARDRAELKLEMVQMSQPHFPARRAPSLPHHTRRHGFTRRSPGTKASLQRSNGRSRCVETYPEGGSYTTWITDPSSSDLSDGNKENYSSLASSSHRRPHHQVLEEEGYSIRVPSPIKAVSKEASQPATPFWASQPVSPRLQANSQVST